MTNQSRRNLHKLIDLYNMLYSLRLVNDRTQEQINSIIGLRLYVYSR